MAGLSEGKSSVYFQLEILSTIYAYLLVSKPILRRAKYPAANEVT
jgi:hypothetical protein